DAIPETEYQEKSGLRAYQLKHYPGAALAPDVHWNFEKFLIDRSGRVTRRFGSDTDPKAPVVVQAIEHALAES
ncbi:MAG: glutathione peroxidase, partial [Gemmatimonas sp.]